MRMQPTPLGRKYPRASRHIHSVKPRAILPWCPPRPMEMAIRPYCAHIRSMSVRDATPACQKRCRDLRSRRLYKPTKPFRLRLISPTNQIEVGASAGWGMRSIRTRFTFWGSASRIVYRTNACSMTVPVGGIRPMVVVMNPPSVSKPASSGRLRPNCRLSSSM